MAAVASGVAGTARRRVAALQRLAASAAENCFYKVESERRGENGTRMCEQVRLEQVPQLSALLHLLP